MSSYPIKVGKMDKTTWWPITSNRSDSMIVGDGIPGDKQTTEFAVRCCNIVYEQAVDETLAQLEKTLNPDLLSKVRRKLLGIG